LYAYGDFTGAGDVQQTTNPSNLSAANIDHVATGVYCLKDLAFTPRSAVVSGDNAFGVNDTIASVITVTPGTAVAPCNAGEAVRVRTTDSAGALADRPFTIWVTG